MARTRVGEGRPALIMSLFVGLVATSACGIERSAPSSAEKSGARSDEASPDQPKAAEADALGRDGKRGRELALATAAASAAPAPGAKMAGGSAPTKTEHDVLDPTSAGQAAMPRPAESEPYRSPHGVREGLFGQKGLGGPPQSPEAGNAAPPLPEPAEAT